MDINANTVVAVSPASDLRRHLQDLYAAGKTVGDDGREFEIFPSGLSEEGGVALRELAISTGVTSTIETGFAYGLSGLFLCEALLEVGDPEARHVAIDPFQAKVWGNSGRRNFREAGVESMLEFLDESSQCALARLSSEGRQFDLAFIDGDHRFGEVFVDFYFMHRLVRPGGLIVVDDMWMPSITCAMRFFEMNLGYVKDPSTSSFVTRPRKFLGMRKRRSRIAVYRRPEEEDARPWDHFVPFA